MAEGGRIELGSVGNPSVVNILATNQGWALDYEGVNNFQDINLSEGAIVDASGNRGGDIQVQGRSVNLTGDAQIGTETLGDEAGGNLTVNASESVELGGGDNTHLFNHTSGTGTSGDLTITTGTLQVGEGAYIENITYGEGRGGNLTVKASKLVILSGTTSDGVYPSGLFAQANGTGNGGNLTIETARLIVQDGAQVATTTVGSGKAGDLMVKATDSVELMGMNVIASGLFAQTQGTGDGGNLTIETARLIVQDGAFASSATFGSGNAGTLTINAKDSILVSGTTPTATIEKGGSGLFASAEPNSTGNGGVLNITTEQLTVEKGAKVNVPTFGTGEAGNLLLNVKNLIIQDGGLVGAGSFAQGNGGTLTVNPHSARQIVVWLVAYKLEIN